MRPAYYNEIDPYCCQWLRNLIAAGHIPAGEVDERDIRDVKADELAGFGQCHFFAGIGGWALALRIAGAEETADIWTGSPPCQDNSVAAQMHGRRIGLRGDRSGLAHQWLDLIGVIKPRHIMFENVPGISPWLSEITDRMEGFGYRVPKSELSSAHIGAPHSRRRVWIVADLGGERLQVTRRSKPSATLQDPRATTTGDYWIEDTSGFRCLDDGLSERVAGVRAFGNAIDPHVAAEVIRSMMQ